MKNRKSVALFLVFGMCVGSALAETNRLKITVGPSVQLGDLGQVNTADLLVSPTGAIAAFVPTRRWPGHEGELWMAYRVSADGGKTWTGQFEAPMPETASPVVGAGVTVNAAPRGPFRSIGPWQHMIRPPKWFSAHIAQFSDDLMDFEVQWLLASVEEAVVVVKEEGGSWRTEKVMPIFDNGQVISLADGQLLLAMHGNFKNDMYRRAFLIQSLDGGRTWRYFSTIAHGDKDPDPELPGEFAGYSAPSITLLPDGQILALLQIHSSDKPPYKPLYVCRSDDQGQTWTKPQPTDPHLNSISPALAVLDNGLVACAHGRPGLHIAFSTDGGTTWAKTQELVKVSQSQVTGQIDMVKTGPNKLLAIAGVGNGGTRVFPVTVELEPEEPGSTSGRTEVGDQADTVEILKITQDKPVKLGPYGYVNSQTLGVSRTGVIAAAVGVQHWPGMHENWITYRVSNDGGHTWTEPMQGFGPVRSGNEGWVALRGGGVLQVGGWRMSAIEGREGWWESLLSRFSDDMMHYEIETIPVYMPEGDLMIREPSPIFMSGPGFGTGKVIQIPNGDLLAPMQGKFKGDTKYRAFLNRSVDRGRTWRYHGTTAYEPVDATPELPGQYIGSAESSVAHLPNGQLLGVMRTQYAHYPGEYRPLNTCWSDDLGKTWTSPVPTAPHLMNIHPNLLVLDNGVVACVYGRPGFHVVFSTDNGHTWKDRVSFSHLPEPNITGQVHANKIGPNKLMVIGGIGTGGTQVFPLTVERVKVSPGHVALTGRVLDEEGNPIANATVERGPNRYAAEDWLEHATELDNWKAAPLIVGNPRLAFRSIQPDNDYPTVRTDAQGRFHFDDVDLGEYVLTVEADHYAPQHRHIKVGPQTQAQDFTLQPGQLVCGRVVDSKGQPIGGMCVVLDQWHCHTDRNGYFHWSVVTPVPEQVALRIFNRYYSDKYEMLETTVTLSQLESQPITLKNG